MWASLTPVPQHCWLCRVFLREIRKENMPYLSLKYFSRKYQTYNSREYEWNTKHIFSWFPVSVFSGIWGEMCGNQCESHCKNMFRISSVFLRYIHFIFLWEIHRRKIRHISSMYFLRKYMMLPAVIAYRPCVQSQIAHLHSEYRDTRFWKTAH